MRWLAVVAVLSVPAATAAEPEPEIDVTLRAGFHHTYVDKDDGMPVGYGPRAEAEVAVAPYPWLAAAVVGSYSTYGTTGLQDGVTGKTYDVDFRDVGLGGRVYLRLYTFAFVGLTVWSQWEREHQTISNASTSTQATAVEFVGGVNVLHFDRYTLSVTGTISKYDNHFSEHVDTWSVTAGIGGCFYGCVSR
jgi:hypothetical protein